jgi:hypothetical protein
MLLVSIVIGERLATTLSSGSRHSAGLADTQLLAVDCMEQVPAGVQHALRVASPLVEPGPATWWQEENRRQRQQLSSLRSLSSLHHRR